MQLLDLTPQGESSPSASELRAIVDTLPVVVWTGRADGSGVDFVSRQFLDYTGLDMTQVLGWGWTDAVHPEDRERFVDCTASILSVGRMAETEMRLRRFDDKYRWFLFRGCPRRDASGALIGWCGVNTDIEHQRRSFDSLPGMVCMNTPDGQIEDVNATTLHYTGRTLEEIRNWACTVHPEDVPVVAARKTHAMTTGEPFDVDVRVLRADGVYRWFHCLGLPFRDSDGRIIRWYDLLIDIDDRRRVEDMLRAREREYREIIDSMPGLVAVWNPHGETEIVNQRALTYFGTSLEDLQRWHHADTIHPDDLPRVADAWARAIASGEPFESEHRLRRHDGEYRWFHLRAIPERDREGNIIRWPVLITDVDERRRADDARRLSEAFLLEVQRLSRTGGFRMDIANNRLEFTPELQRAFRVPEDATNQDTTSPEFWLGRIHADERERVWQTFQRCVQERTSYREAFRIVRGDGTIGYQHAAGCPVFNDAGDLIEYVGASMDTTDQWLAATELERASQAVQDMERKLARAAQVAVVGELAAAIAHEVNQPLAAVVANGHACLRWLSSAPRNMEKAVEAAERIVKDGKDAGEVVRRVRSLFKHAPVEDVALNLNDVIRDVLRLLDADVTRRHVAVGVTLESDLPAIRGDRVQLQQLVWNLTLNALDAVETLSDRAKQVSIRSRRAAEDAVIEIADNGVGLVNAETVFEPFFTTKVNGMGMGLAICRSIAAAHGGTLSAACNRDYGTTFSFTMPFVPDIQ